MQETVLGRSCRVSRHLRHSLRSRMASASFTALTSIALLLMVVHSAHLQSLADQHPSKSAQEVLRVAAIEVADEVSATCMVLDLVTPRTGLLAFAGAVALMLYALAGSDFRTTA